MGSRFYGVYRVYGENSLRHKPQAQAALKHKAQLHTGCDLTRMLPGIARQADPVKKRRLGCSPSY